MTLVGSDFDNYHKLIVYILFFYHLKLAVVGLAQW